MFATGVRQGRFAWSILTGRRFHPATLEALVRDLRATIAEFGSPGAGAAEVVTGAAAEARSEISGRHIARAVTQARTGTSYYRNLLSGIDFDTSGPKSLTSVAPTPKSALRADPAAFVWNRSRPELLVETTGTTGTPTSLWYSRYELAVMAATSAMALMVHGGLRPEHTWVSCVRSRSLAQRIQERAVGMTGASYALLGIVDPAVVLDRLTTPLGLAGKSPKVTHMITTASFLGALVQRAERTGLRSNDFGLAEIHLGGEILTDALAERARNTFGADIIDGYSATEIMPVAGTACAQGHLHIPEDQGYVEVLLPGSDRPAPPGSLGVLTVTPYPHYRDTTRLLRYRTGDLVRTLPADEHLTCPLAALPATSRIVGREQSVRFDPALTTRDLLETLQSEPGLPLPTRYALGDDAGRPVVHVVADQRTRPLLTRLEQRIADRGLPLHGIVLVNDPDELPAPCPVRADLREDGWYTRPAASGPGS